MIGAAPMLVLLWAAGPTPAPGCHELTKAVAAGKASAGDLRRRCQREDFVVAALAATAPVDRKGLVSGEARGGGVLQDDRFYPYLLDETRVAWQGRCLAQLKEALPEPTPVPPASCLDDAVITEVDAPGPVEDLRAGWLSARPVLLTRWRACWRRGSAERCLDGLLPLSGPGRVGDSAIADWTAARGADRAGTDPPREARCRLVLADTDSGWVAFRCEGTLAEDACQSIATATFDAGRVEHATCADDKRSLVVLGELGARPPPVCVTAARAAIEAPPTRFAAARAVALNACTTDPARTEKAETPSLPDWGDADPPPALQALIGQVLARQHALFGTLSEPRHCRRAGGGCVETEDGDLGRVIGRGCGNVVWTVEPTGSSGFSDGHWSEEDDRHLVRLPAGSRPRLPDGSAIGPATIRRHGDYFHEPLGNGKKVVREANLIAETCVARGRPSELCEAIALGGRPTDMSSPGSPAAWRRALDVVRQDWPRAFRRLARWQRELTQAARLDPINGEQAHWRCGQLLVDACTGHVAEVCTGLSAEEPRCPGRHLPDGRCRRYGLERLPLSPAAPSGRR